jgi:hypothetical protein
VVTGIRPHARFLGRPATKNNKLIELLQGAEQLEDEPMAPHKAIFGRGTVAAA